MLNVSYAMKSCTLQSEGGDISMRRSCRERSCPLHPAPNLQISRPLSFTCPAKSFQSPAAQETSVQEGRPPLLLRAESGRPSEVSRASHLDSHACMRRIVAQLVRSHSNPRRQNRITIQDDYERSGSSSGIDMEVDMGDCMLQHESRWILH